MGTGAIKYGLPQFENQFKKTNDVIDYGLAIAHVARADPGVIQHVIPLLEDRKLTPADLIDYGDVFSEIAGVAKRSGYSDLADIVKQLTVLRGQIKNSADLRAYGLALASVAPVPLQKNETRRLSTKARLMIVAEFIHNPQDLEYYSRALAAIARTYGGDAVLSEMQLLKAKSQKFWDRDFFLERLREDRNGLQTPYSVDVGPHGHWESGGSYGSDSWVDESPYVTFDPDKSRREEIDNVIHSLVNQGSFADLFQKLRQEEPAGLPEPAEDFDSHGRRESQALRLSENLIEFNRFLRKEGLTDVVVMGGAVRDALLGRAAKDLDINFKLAISDDERRLSIEQHAWNQALASRLDERIGCLAFALGVTVEDLLAGRARFGDLAIHYAGPYWFEYEVAEGRRVRSSLVGAIFNASGKMESLDPMVSINSLGIDSDGNLIGDGRGLDDLKTKTLRTLKPVFVDRLRPLQVLRLVEQSAQLGFSLSPELENSLKEYAVQKSGDITQFIRSTDDDADFQNTLKRIVDLDGTGMLRQLGLAPLLLKTTGVGAAALQERMRDSNPTDQRSGQSKLDFLATIVGLGVAVAVVAVCWPALSSLL